MKVLITGANGQLGKDLVQVFGQDSHHEIYAFGRDKLDITDADQCSHVVSSLRPDVVIHSASYTAVDQAESDIEGAYRVNADGTRNVVVAAERAGSRFCYISTDYVFDGTSSVPYREYDNTNPQSVYGQSKRAGEVLVQSLSSRFYIVRTSWVYGIYGSNFVKTMLKLGKEKSALKVVDDQVGSPTYTLDLSRFLLELTATEKYGLYHASNQGQCSWYEFAKAIFEESGLEVEVNPCATKDFPRPAPRPGFSLLDSLAIRTNGFTELRPWREALKDFLKRLEDGQS
ncbi:dTDP-4-dehydrorhamnose reductase [Paenibacillus senegalensis]|uniref:dTDP-4-dehydrorhamnose reductase n=1 Tax=Paenibacillus senegalensis TaxID=1465766 RepID=UPI0002895496|nr:dTDP-4-dehydrorhamnose reductase [Paenibacillus senegalensis]